MTARWVHGTAFEAEYPDRLVRRERKGWGSSFFMKPGTTNWFHIAIPTPALIDGVRPLLSRIFVLYGASRGAGATFGSTLTDVHVYDGKNKVWGFDGERDGGHTGSIDSDNTFSIDPPLTIYSGLGISVCAICPKGLPDEAGGYQVSFATVGADFTRP